ncbi:MAG: DUF4397 domain-containing protein [Bacteroidetes bacterium]|nr:DUF4397 domain-containing protein [Bacteroidota bacterium]
MRVKTLLAVLFLSTGAIDAGAQAIKMQFINNCADVSLNGVDIYVNGILAVDNLNFRTATIFTDYFTVPVNKLEIGIAPATSATVNDTFFSRSITFTTPTPCIAVINGVRSASGYSPYKKMSIDILNNAVLNASVSGNTDYVFMNGSTDAPTLDVRSGLNMVGNDLAYGNFTAGYTSTPTSDFKIRLTNTTGSKTINTYNADFATKNLTNEACIIVSSGFMDPSSNSNGAAFGLWLATPNGGQMTQLQTTTPEALSRAQFINNCADTTADTVDVYLDNTRILDNFAFRTASAFMDMTAKTAHDIDIAPKNSSSVNDKFYHLSISLDSGKKYIFLADGIQSSKGYTPALPYVLHYTKNAMEDAASTGNTDVCFAQGSTDASLIDLKESGNTLVSGASYGSFAAYQPLGATYHRLSLTQGSKTTDYDADLGNLGLQNLAVAIVASGFVTQTANSNGPYFGLWVALPSGGALKKLPISESVFKLANNKDFKIWPNPVQNSLHISTLDNQTILSADVLDITGRTVLQNQKLSNNALNTSSLAPGNYVLKFVYQGQIAALRFSK